MADPDRGGAGGHRPGGQAARRTRPRDRDRLQSAEGLEAGKTAVRYKDVQIGVVQSVRLAKDRSRVRVAVQLVKDAEGFTATDTRFWVVRPRLDTSGISGLGTLLSGAYIGVDPGVSEEESREFQGLEIPPVVTRDSSGKQFRLSAQDLGSLDIGSPVYYRRIKVGQIASFELSREGKGVDVQIFVNAPYDSFVGENTRFWQASGIDMQLNSSGVTLRTQSLASILLGGVAFGAPENAAGTQAPENSAFVLASDETTAMKIPDGPPQTALVYFNQSLRGLAPGAAVDFRGVVIGEVKSIGVEYVRAQKQFRMPVVLQIYPNRLPMAKGEIASEKTQLEQLRFAIERGMRAQLRNGNLLTGQLYVALDFFPRAARVQVDLDRVPVELPTMPGSLDELQSQVQEIVGKVNRIPIEEIGRQTRVTLATLDKSLQEVQQLTRSVNRDIAPEVAAAVKDARRTLDSAEKTLAQDSPLQQDMRDTLQELTRTAASVRLLTDYLERHPESLIRGKTENKK